MIKQGTTLQKWRIGKMLIGITKKTHDRYKSIKIETISERPEALYCWHANKFTYERKTGLHIMNDLTRYSVVLYDIKKKEMENLTKIFKTQLKTNLISDGIDELKIQRYLNDLGEVTFVKTSSRSIIGQLNDSFYHLESVFQEVGTITQYDLDYINNQINYIPMIALEKLGYKPFPNIAMKTELSKLY